MTMTLGFSYSAVATDNDDIAEKIKGDGVRWKYKVEIPTTFIWHAES